MSDVDSDYEHWPDNASMYSSKTVAATGYNNRNGLHEHQYQRADSDDLKKRTKAAVPPHLVAQAPTHVCYQARPQAPLPSPYMMQAGTPYTCYPGAYYGMPSYSNPHQYAMPGYHCCDNCAAPKEEKKQKTVEAPAPTKWQGRTRAEVDEDNMKIAAGHGAYDERKVEPKGLKPDQMVWVVEPDGAQTLRAYATVTEMDGEWMADPRFKNSWYFVRPSATKQKK